LKEDASRRSAPIRFDIGTPPVEALVDSPDENRMSIGLATSHAFVQAYEEELWATNDPKLGSTFSLLLKAPDVVQGSEFSVAS
jgi:hypothetical protein